jgi:hypothetical protein
MLQTLLENEDYQPQGPIATRIALGLDEYKCLRFFGLVCT